ncbi:MAG: TldD/PmbA family protein [Candidatus Saganbacteria bacterium]|nr:TldD/PmbA family protein [Candidatus Saganbacteria bacterium]
MDLFPVAEITHDLFKKAKSKGIDEVEIFAAFHQGLSIEILDQKVEALKDIQESGIGIRIIKDKKLGFAFSSILDPDTLEETLELAIAGANNTAQDEFQALPSFKPDKNHGLDLFDPEIKQKSIQEKIQLALDAEKQAYAYSPKVKKTEQVSYGETEYEVFILNSHGIDVSYQGNSCGLGAMIIAIDGESMEMGFESDVVTKYRFLDAAEIGKTAARKAVTLLGAQKIKSSKLAIVLDREVGAELLEVISGLFSAESVQKGKSLLKGKLGKQIAAPAITIVDDGRKENLVGSSPYDGEGVPTQKTILVSNGNVNAYLYNTYTANKDKVKSTGNAARGSFAGLPGTDCHNVYFEAGKHSKEEIVSQVSDGVYITGVMGIHTINPISGDLSIGAEGFKIEKGKITFAIKGITIATNLIELLEAIEMVGSDLRFHGSVGSPTLLISEMSVGGD